MNKLYKQKQFLSQEELTLLQNYVKQTARWTSMEDAYWNDRCLYTEAILEDERKDIYNLVVDIKKRIAEAIKSFYDKDVVPDLINFVRWPEGIDQPPHCDDMTDQGERTSWFHHREFGAVIYLNSDFVGGKTYYPNFSYESDLEPGMLVVHPGNPEYTHGVTKVFHGTRYTLASFWTTDKFYERPLNEV